MTSAIAAAVIVLGASMISGGVAAETVTFGKTQIGDVPKAFETARTGSGHEGVWGVVEDPQAEGGRALEQRTPDTTDYRFPLAIYAPAVARDLDVTVRFKTISGRVDRAGGLAVRVLDEKNYYVVRANALEDNVRFYRVVRGNRQQIAGADTRVTSGEWHTLGLKAEGERFTISFDGRELFSATDKAFGAEGRVALWTKADSITRFDRIEIRRAE
jgi:hypothetical protein